MLIIVGLGNPGNKYEHTRHNVGFDCVEIIAQKLNVKIDKKRGKALIAETYIGDEKVVLAKPQTYMNLSGQAVVELLNWYKVPPENCLIIYDDVDLPFANVRFRPKGSAGTHNGMRNILELSPSDNFPRFKVGIGKPPLNYPLANWVLSTYNSKEERAEIFDAYMLTADAAIVFAKHGVDEARMYLSKQLALKGNKETSDAQ
ncbi:MAG: aminoacyl-tRNA hydrolase [Christensenellaceae bacterium]|nr:aminoacyl-tRNA hydrolase [Christensenellaceae bacterium]